MRRYQISRRELGWCAFGGAVAALGFGHGGGPLWRRAPSSGPLALWLADRARGEVLGCDADGIVGARLALPTPVALAADGRGGAWVASALEGLPWAAHALLRMAPSCVVRERWACAALGPNAHRGVLTVDVEGRPIVIEPVGGVRVATRFDRDGPRSLALGFEPACVAARGEHVWIAGVHGEVVAFAEREIADDLDGVGLGALRRAGTGRSAPTPTTAPQQRVPPGVIVRALRPDADGRGAWLLGARGAVALVGRWQLAEDGAPRRLWVRWFDLTPGALAATSHGTAWLADARAPVAVCLASDGRVRVWRRRLPGEGIEDALATPDGGAWLAAAGALLRVAPDGGTLPGQGGLGHGVALAPATTDVAAERAALR